MTAGNINKHLMKCQPNGAMCVKCGKVIPADKFMEHYESCTPASDNTAALNAPKPITMQG
jgi:hypothetical protein